MVPDKQEYNGSVREFTNVNMVYRPVAVLIVQRDLIVFIMNLIIARHHFGGQNQDRVYSPVCLIGHFGHNRVSFRALPTLLNNII